MPDSDTTFGVRAPTVEPPAAAGSAPQGIAVPAPTPSPRYPRRRPYQVLAIVVVLAAGFAGWLLALAIPWLPRPELFHASGTIETDEVLVGPEVSGQILALAKEGQPVGTGDVVVRLDDSLIQLQIRQAVDPAQQQQLTKQAERFQLRAPISGVVTRVPMHVGEVASPGQTIAAVSDLTSLKLTVYVLEHDLGRVQVGQQVAVTADPFGSRAFQGIVTSINPRAEFTPRNVQTKADRLNLVFGVQVRVDNPDGALKPGMPADATFLPLS